MFYIQLVDYMQKCFSLTEDTIEGAVDGNVLLQADRQKNGI